jgi:hypothetical protein
MWHISLIAINVFLVIVLMILQTGYLFAQLPSFYNHVDHVIWVVKDLQKVKSGWEQLGFKEIKDYGKVTIESSIESETSKALMATAGLGGLRVIWLQPLKMKGLLARFNQMHGDAVYSLVHSTNGQSDLLREVDRMRRKKVPVQQHLVIRYKNKLLEYVMFDTRREGKYGLALIPQVQVSEIFGIGNMGSNDYGLEFSQFAFAIKDPDTVSAFWSRGGVPGLGMEHPVVYDKNY